MAKRRLTDRDRDVARARYLAGESQSAIAASFGVSARTVTNVLAAAGIKSTDRVAGKRTSTSSRAAALEAGAAGLEPYAELGPPPPDPLKRMEWMQGVLALAFWRRATGQSIEGEPEMVDQLIQLAKASATVNPPSAMYHARTLIETDADELSKPGGPELETDAPQVTDRDYRGAPRRGRPKKL